jgi:hypothetical protein
VSGWGGTWGDPIWGSWDLAGKVGVGGGSWRGVGFEVSVKIDYPVERLFCKAFAVVFSTPVLQ